MSTIVDMSTWRERELRRAGFPAELATRISRYDAYDLHALLALVDRGCPPHLAARILAPIDALEDEGEALEHDR